jgi:hypothetical protein
MEHFIALTVRAKDAKKNLAKIWYQVVSDNLTGGLTTTVQTGDTTARMKLSKNGEKVTLTIPLVRNLTANEVEEVIGCLNECYSKDFSVSSSRLEIGVKDEVEVEIDHGPLLSLCTAWAKQKHDEWMKDKVDSGWRYGPSVSMANKTHPLIRTWSDLPDAYRKVDTSQAEGMLKLMNEHGYVMIAKHELDQLMRENGPTD